MNKIYRLLLINPECFAALIAYRNFIGNCIIYTSLKKMLLKQVKFHYNTVEMLSFKKMLQNNIAI
jgi:hypothetical protein